MTESPPTNTGTGSADDAVLSVQEQLDLLLAQIETAEPGTVEPTHLPKSFASPKTQAAAKPATTPPPSAEEPAELAEALADFEAALDTEQTVEQPVAPPPAPSIGDDSESQMLAALNAALLDLKPRDKPAAPAPSAQPAAAAEPASRQADEKTDTRTTEQRLQDEINALLSAPTAPAAQPKAPTPAKPVQPVTTPAAEAPKSSLEDQLASEIQSLLESAPEPAEASADAQPSIDQLDRMLAEEIDEDDELAGDFESVHAITAGIDTGSVKETEAIDVYAATAQDVADELDNQPEDLAVAKSENSKQVKPEAAPARRDDAAYDDEPSSWLDKLEAAKDVLLRLCFLVNWPVRRYMSAESRASLGYVALLNLFVAVAVWLYVIFF